ncbi:hypothetical protein AB0F15_23065 [Amycolatopsis sp. NPDC026612]|uniref:hypothetical protein n=1 Tax=Amycolatopsis sp. NPDC026612 TaxID=3155466 RepID=UPI0033F50FCC
MTRAIGNPATSLSHAVDVPARHAELAFRATEALPVARIADPVRPSTPDPPPPPAPVVQRDPEPAAAPAPAPASAPAAVPHQQPPETEELVKKLFDPLLRRLKTELRLDRERRGALTDRPH